MATPSDSDLVQLIDYDGEMTADLERWMQDQGLADVGFNYNVITILGSQSSGKSTLMNALFGCNFQVMDALKGYSQTTKGLWIGRDHLGRNIGIGDEAGKDTSSSLDRPVLLLDVEGLDSRERGERRQTYENFFSLFALALADCLLVNISCAALGCHTGSGFGLLKTVMEANLELFMHQDDAPKTILLFVVRDWAPSIVPEDVMREKIEKDYVNKIWAEIQKPDSVADSSAADFFTVEVFGLAHKLLAPAEFEKGVCSLRERWAEAFSPKSYTRKIPADGFGAYARSIWETIKQQSHLDIPNQKEMLAIYRCQDLKREALQAATSRAAVLQQNYPKPTAANAAAISGSMESIAKDALGLWLLAYRAVAAAAQYLSQAARYQEKICTSVKAELIDAIAVVLKPMVDAQLTEARETIARRHKDALREAYTKDARDTAVSARGESMLEAWAAFNKRSEERSIRLEGGEHLHFPSNLIADALQVEMHQEVEAIRETQQKALDEAIAEKCADSFTGIDAHLTTRNFTPHNFWEACRGRAATSATLCAAQFAAAGRGLAADIPDGDAAVAEAAAAEFAIRCRLLALWQLRICLSKLVGGLHVYILERFSSLFSYDDDDHPRRWELVSAEKLQSLFLTAKTQALALIPTLREVQLERLSLTTVTLEAHEESEDMAERAVDTDGEDDKDRKPMPAAYYRPLIDPISAQTIQRKAVAAMQQQCREAQLLQQRCGSSASWRSVPMWGWLLLVCLGWNEIAMVFSFMTRNWLALPLLFMALLLVAGVFMSGQVEVATHGARHAVQLIRLLLQPFLHGLLKTVTDMMDPSGLAGRGVVLSPREGASVKESSQQTPNEVAALKERAAKHSHS
ncbi:root hair defective 3 GTP-binding protein [Cyclospora cayetanensis]|uniref:Protein SEY1 homolog n=1 Tax=Cyclospora cayetanensis TaxID=88456 RepID=A0A1D3D0T5_9EIME|nr:root hair defective 3 GTP-binding protein [Cyclospora cayetanensis]